MTEDEPIQMTEDEVIERFASNRPMSNRELCLLMETTDTMLMEPLQLHLSLNLMYFMKRLWGVSPIVDALIRNNEIDITADWKVVFIAISRALSRRGNGIQHIDDQPTVQPRPRATFCILQGSFLVSRQVSGYVNFSNRQEGATDIEIQIGRLTNESFIINEACDYAQWEDIGDISYNNYETDNSGNDNVVRDPDGEVSYVDSTGNQHDLAEFNEIQEMLEHIEEIEGAVAEREYVHLNEEEEE